MKRNILGTILLPVLAIGGLISLLALKNDLKENFASIKPADAALTLPAGFNASVIADKLGGARHLVVTPQGDIYLKIRGVSDGKGIVLLHQANGKAEIKSSFGLGGTGIYIKNGYLYGSTDHEVYRYKLNANDQVIDPAKPELVVSGLIGRNEHEPKAILLDNAGYLYVNIGAYSNSCQVKDRQKGSMGQKGCPILDSAAGIWRFSANKLNQHYSDGIRYATGLRNVVGMAWNTQLNQLFVMQHGRDQLHDIFPDLYTTKQSALLPAECMYAIKKGDNAGWPYIYYDEFQHKKILAPEYGGDGKKEGGKNAIDPVVAFPGHLAPDGLLFYTGSQFPARYKNGAFIA
ncbi:MAG: PQQ-dependent sugar dehydrogenase, partial [Mucilaginibacter sp.]